MPDTRTEDALERIRAAISKKRLPSIDDVNFVTISVSRLKIALQKSERDRTALFEANTKASRQSWEAREEVERLRKQVQLLQTRVAQAEYKNAEHEAHEQELERWVSQLPKTFAN